MNKHKKRRNSRSHESRSAQSVAMPSRYEGGGYRLVHVFVEGYDDVAFWRNIFDDFETDWLKFEISVPPREDLAKGKKVLLGMIPECSEDRILCMDSDFDYMFQNFNEQSRLVNHTPFLFHTYAYATENYLCYPPSLHRICVKATKNDTLIFDFERFMTEYSRTIYPLFLWYAFSARQEREKAFSLFEFRSSVRLNYLDLRDDGNETLLWLGRQVDKRVRLLEMNFPEWVDDVNAFGREIEKLGVTTDNVYFFMQGHTLLDNVVLILLNAVCERLREMAVEKIVSGTKQGISLKNELSNYNNSLRNVREVLLDNEQYKECFLYKKLRKDIEQYVRRLIEKEHQMNIKK
ncbi:MAG TPA: DUF4435 domain-containing protein [Candidatus Alistipes merdigallinarum]|nr:DUF4435 domain-containing protein [Candidatus Alistipes merdigallinarum]